MKKLLVFASSLLIGNLTSAQFIKEKAINAQLGYGMSFPYESENDVTAGGLFLQAEYVLKAASWFEMRPYAGLVFTNSNGKDFNGNPTDEKAETRALLLGGKARVIAPIPYVAPYFEIGVGTSIGRFETQTVYSSHDKSGVIAHIPFSIGLELGKQHNVDIAFTYFFQPSVEQTVGAFAFGLKFPITD